MSAKIPKQFWYYHENSDGYVQLTREEWAASFEIGFLQELGPVKEGTDDESRKLHAEYIKINRDPYDAG